jgi:formate hydrogenlyase subunit 3/multisubunit Na+/H+ antiporter MnhD subunit
MSKEAALSSDAVITAVAAWVLAGILGLAGADARAGRALLVIGAVIMLAGAILVFPAGGADLSVPLVFGETFHLSGDAAWLLGFGLPGAALAAVLGPPGPRRGLWVAGAAASLIGALGVFGLRDAVGLLIAWELMSLGGALMILGEDQAVDRAGPTLFMLGLLEVGAVALFGALLLLCRQAGAVDFTSFGVAAGTMSASEQLLIAILFLVGFGAKLGLLPFYEWFPKAYGAASGATGAVMSGVVLNAAFFALGRALLVWLPAGHDIGASASGIIVVAVAVPTSILAALYAFQQLDWRRLLSLSSAENAAIAVCLLGVSLMFRQAALPDLAALAWTVAVIHLGGHALAKSSLFLCADAVRRATGSYDLVQRGVLKRAPWPLGVGAVFGAMSLAAMPPTIGFASEWFTFQTLFQGFHLPDLTSRLVAAVAGAGLALTAAIALAAFVKVFGLGLLGRSAKGVEPIAWRGAIAVGLLGVGALAAAVILPWTLHDLSMRSAVIFGADAPLKMHDHLLLVPLTAKFAFISPTLLVVVMPLLALAPVLLLLATRRRAVRIAPVWYGGRSEDRAATGVTALAFSNALRTFYSFIYRPTAVTAREAAGADRDSPYFTKRLTFNHDIAPIFETGLFAPIQATVVWLSVKVSVIQSGRLNLYLTLVGALLVIILGISLL